MIESQKPGAACAVLVLALGGAAILPVAAVAATPEEACRAAIAQQTGGPVGEPKVSVGTDGITTVTTFVSGTSYTCFAEADGKVINVMQDGGMTR